MPKPNYTPEYKGIAKEELIKMRKNKLNPGIIFLYIKITFILFKIILKILGLFHLYKDLLYIVDSHM